jgi:FKBP-type peptidyl-prolyl cis-trans isomerase SlyD
MQIADQKVAVIHYKLTDSEGKVIDSSEGQEPMPYLHGAANLVPGLEKELIGKAAGDKLSVVVSPEDGYGHKEAAMVQELPRTSFGGVEEIKVGMEFQAQTENGMQVVEVIELSDETVTIDGNHPLAGVELHFDIEVVEVREATATELEQGHIGAASGAAGNECAAEDHAHSDCCNH